MAKKNQLPADHPGTYILEELNERGLAQADLAYILGWDVSQLNRLIKGVMKITPDSAMALSDALGMDPEFFTNLQMAYDLHRARNADPGIKTRASWISVFPIREMIKRRWIEESEPSLLDLQMMRFFGKTLVQEIPFVSDAPVLAHAARKTSYAGVTAVQYAWLNRVRKIAETIDAPPYSEEALRKSLPSIRAHMLDKDDLIQIPEILHQCGIRFVLVEALPGSKIDGVCLWIDGQPVIGMTLRLDRMDNFCFVLRHEIEHVLNNDGKEETFSPVDEFDSGYDNNSDLPDIEKVANNAAAAFCVPPDLFNSFILRKSPYISEKDVLAFSARIQINPAIVVGQIQNRTKKYSFLRKYQTSIREKLMDWKFKDGWGHFAPTGV